MTSPAPRSARRGLLLLALLAAFALHIHKEQKSDPELIAAFEVLDVGSDAVLPGVAVVPRVEPPLVAGTPSQVQSELVSGPSGSYEVAAGELLVRLRAGADPDDIEAALVHAGAQWIRVGANDLWRVGFDRSRSVEQLAADVRDLTGDVTVRGNALVRAATCGAGDLVGLQWEQSIVEGNKECADSYDLPDVRVAILDTGVAYEDYEGYVQVSELAGVPVVDPWDFINNDAHANDDNGHGTHLAGLIAAQDRLRGHAPTPELMPIKVLDQDRVGTEWALVQGLYWAADHGAQVVNLSLVFGTGYLPGADLVGGIEAVLANGGVVVAAAGNAGLEQVGYPAALPGVIAVGAGRLKDGELKYVDYSNQGFAIDLAGPGGDVTRDENDDSIPDGMLAQTISPDDPSQVDYWVMAGTSQATAVVAGQAAWVLANGVPAPQVQKVLTFGRSDALNGYGDGSNGDRQEFGDGAPSSAEFSAYFSEAARDALPELFVHVVQAVKGSGSKRKAQAWVQVIDATGTSVQDVEVYATFRGDDYKEVHAKTDSDGIVKLESGDHDYHQDDPAAFFMLTIDGLRVEVNGEKYAIDPGGYYPLSEANANLIAGAIDANPGEGLLFHIDPSAQTDCSPFNCNEIDDSWLARSLGGGFAGSVVSMTFNTKWFQTVGGAGFAGSVVSLSFAYPQYFSWGMSDTAAYEVWELDGSGFAGSVVSAIPWEGSFWSWGSGFAGSVVSMLSYDVGIWGTGYGSSDIVIPDETTDLWGSGFAGSVVSMSSYYSSWSWGSGFAGSVVSMGHWSSLMFGGGFAGSVVSRWSWTPTLFAAGSDEVLVAQSLGTGKAPIDL